MDTDTLRCLCRLSEKYKSTAESLEKFETSDSKSLSILFPNKAIDLNFDDYPELKPLVEKIKKYILKSETERQNAIKLEIMKVLGK